jgi:hypothetical protein
VSEAAARFRATYEARLAWERSLVDAEQRRERERRRREQARRRERARIARAKARERAKCVSAMAAFAREHSHLFTGEQIARLEEMFAQLRRVNGET